jgi:hypothetical protein
LNIKDIYIGIFRAILWIETIETRRNGMKWVETIKVQAAAGFEMAMEKKIKVLTRDLLAKNTGGSGLVEALIYNHASVPGHLAICLIWKTEDPQTTGSLIGLNLSQTLKTFGLVDHSVWVEKQKRGERG